VGFRIAIVVGWVAALGALLFWGEAPWAPWAAAAVTIAAGALVGRWWVLLVPVVGAVLYGAVLLIDGADPGERWDSEPIVYVFAIAIAGAAVAFLLAVGVALRKLRT
jgi:hypothetical protein